MSLINEALKQAADSTRREHNGPLAEYGSATGSGQRRASGMGPRLLAAAAASLFLTACIVAAILLVGQLSSRPHAETTPQPPLDNRTTTAPAASGIPTAAAPTQAAEVSTTQAPVKPRDEDGIGDGLTQDRNASHTDGDPTTGDSGQSAIRTPLITTPGSPDTLATAAEPEPAEGSAATPRPYRNYVVNAIMAGSGGYMALLNSQTVREGDRLDAHTVVNEIGEQSVTLSIDGIPFRIPLRSLPDSDPFDR